jgi:hypothetical protein
MDRSDGNYETKNSNSKKSSAHSKNGDLVVEDLDELNRLYVNREDPTASGGSQIFMKPLTKKKRKKGTKKTNPHGNHNSKLKHWELLALQQSKEETCNCRHHVMRLEADHIVYDWCRCKDHQHKELTERRKSISVPPPPEEPIQPTPAPRPPPRPKTRKVHKKSVGVNATEPETTELALAYDPSTVDYDTIQEVIYYRTSSGRLV